MAEKERFYRATTVIREKSPGDVVRKSDFEDLPEGRFDELVERGVFVELSDVESEALSTQTITDDRQGGETDDQFADETRADVLRNAERLRTLEEGHRAHEEERKSWKQDQEALREEVKTLRDQQEQLLESLKARQTSHEEGRSGAENPTADPLAGLGEPAKKGKGSDK